MSDISEQARAEAHERWGSDGYKSSWRSGMMTGFVLGAEWAASLTPEPSEDVSNGLAGSVDVSKIGPKVDTSGASEDVREALGLIDQTIYANEDNPSSVRWTNVEVICMLQDIRAALTVTPKPTKKPAEPGTEPLRDEDGDPISSGEHRKISMNGDDFYVCDTCTNILGLNIRWDQSHPGPKPTNDNTNQ